jgi:hypothetical protein
MREPNPQRLMSRPAVMTEKSFSPVRYSGRKKTTILPAWLISTTSDIRAIQELDLSKKWQGIY